jgi:hypothetical protein
MLARMRGVREEKLEFKLENTLGAFLIPLFGISTVTMKGSMNVSASVQQPISWLLCIKGEQTRSS